MRRVVCLLLCGLGCSASRNGLEAGHQGGGGAGIGGGGGMGGAAGSREDAGAEVSEVGTVEVGTVDLGTADDTSGDGSDSSRADAGFPTDDGGGVSPHGICSEDGWCWENPLPQGRPLNAVWGSSESDVWTVGRSEEHTSELQSRPHLVCRLLLEKKKNNIN